MARVLGITAAALGFMLISGCQSSNDYEQQRRDTALQHFNEISKRGANLASVYTLPACIGDAMKNNLNLKVEELQAAIEQENKTAAMLGMLPRLQMDYELKTRTNQPGATSIDLKTGATSLQYSRSSEKTEYTYEVELAYSTLDFGMAYFNSVQAQDRILLARNQKERVARNLRLEVAAAYFDVVASQDAINTTRSLLERTKGIDAVFRALKESKSISQLRLLDERKRYIDLERRMMEFERSHEDACVKLRSLMGYLPLAELTVDTTILGKVDFKKLPDVETLEMAALRKRPELSELDIQQHVNIQEARKAILTMIPTVKLFTDWQYSSNPLLYNQNWWEIGMRASYDLLKLPSKVMKYRSIGAKSEELELRTKALSVAIMAQVRLAHSDWMEAQKMFRYNDKVYKVYRQSLEMARKSYRAGSALSRVEMNRMELEAAEKYIVRTQSLSNCYLSYYRLINAVGAVLSDKEYQEIRKSFGVTSPQMASR
ncbi:MAG: TolC family protein [Victivallales bacterium]|nr:TolC family protein [Victivallales bacterium]